MKWIATSLLALLLAGCDAEERAPKDLKCYQFTFYNDPASARALKVLPFMYSIYLYGDENVVLNSPDDRLRTNSDFIPDPPVSGVVYSFPGSGRGKHFPIYKGFQETISLPLYLRFEKEIITDDAIIFEDSYGKLWRLKSAFPLPEYLKERFKNGTLIGPGSLKVYCDIENKLHIEFSHRRKPKSSQGMVWEYVPQCEQ